MEIIKILSSIKEPLLLAFGILSGILMHMVKCHLDEKNETKKRSRQLTIDSAEKIKTIILKIDEIINGINFDEPDIDNQNHLYAEIENHIKKIHVVQREISDERFQSHIDEFNSAFAIVRMAHWLESNLEPDMLSKYKEELFCVTSNKEFHDEVIYLYYNSFEKLMKYINTGI